MSGNQKKGLNTNQFHLIFPIFHDVNVLVPHLFKSFSTKFHYFFHFPIILLNAKPKG